MSEEDELPIEQVGWRRFRLPAEKRRLREIDDEITREIDEMEASASSPEVGEGQSDLPKEWAELGEPETYFGQLLAELRVLQSVRSHLGGVSGAPLLREAEVVAWLPRSSLRYSHGPIHQEPYQPWGLRVYPRPDWLFGHFDEPPLPRFRPHYKFSERTADENLRRAWLVRKLQEAGLEMNEADALIDELLRLDSDIAAR